MNHNWEQWEYGIKTVDDDWTKGKDLKVNYRSENIQCAFCRLLNVWVGTHGKRCQHKTVFFPSLLKEWGANWRYARFTVVIMLWIEQLWIQLEWKYGWCVLIIVFISFEFWWLVLIWIFVVLFLYGWLRQSKLTCGNFFKWNK